MPGTAAKCSIKQTRINRYHKHQASYLKLTDTTLQLVNLLTLAAPAAEFAKGIQSSTGLFKPFRAFSNLTLQRCDLQDKEQWACPFKK